MYCKLDGIWDVELADGSRWQMRLPGTLDESAVGYTDTGENAWKAGEMQENGGSELYLPGPDGGADQPPRKAITTRFTRCFTYEGQAAISRQIEFSGTEERRLFLEVERARSLRLFVDGTEYLPMRPASLSTPYLFELTGIADGLHTVTFLSDNSYPGWPREDIVYSSAATDETQTNWNGLLGKLALYTGPSSLILDLRVYPDACKLNVES